MVRGKDISFSPSDIKRMLKLKSNPFHNAASYHERKADKDYRFEEVLEDLCLEGKEWVHHRDGRPHYLKKNDLDPMAKEIIADQFYKFVYKTDLSSSLPFSSIIAALCLEAKVVIKEDTYIPQEPPIVGEVMTRARQPRQEAPPQQQPP
ncbi:hypothetical protein PIB30_039423 [Stylosanthes scabra]|uniref:Uncharacterized protein n=1 Tax=Stylosanthes scabra TaxID=79078 RepID=A0ABU6SF36_9FABA|nr:hypothetical protein [Stylosanthes scabra]